jgi:hypothetical protein
MCVCVVYIVYVCVCCLYCVCVLSILCMSVVPQVRDVEAIVKRFKTDLHNCVGYIQDPKMLKESIKALYQKHVQEDIVSPAVGVKGRGWWG